MDYEDYSIYERAMARQMKGTHMEPTAIKQVQPPEIYLAADVEQMAKGGWKRTVKCSIRIFDGNTSDIYESLTMLIDNGLLSAQAGIEDYERAMEEKAETNGPE